MSQWILCTINSTLMPVFLTHVFNQAREHQFQIYLDPEIIGNKVIIKKDFLETLKSFMDSKFFINYKQKIHLNALSPQIDLDKFLNYRKSLNDVKIKVGGVVRLQLDGLLYTVQSIDPIKSKAIITRSGKHGPGLSIRVSLDSIVPTLKEQE